MKNKNAVIAIITIVVVGIAITGYVIASKGNTSNNTVATAPSITTTQTSTITSTSVGTNTPTTSSVQSTTPVPTGKTDNFTIHANDDSADLTNINVKVGDTVKITFSVDDQGTYHGGLKFVAPDAANSSGPIAIGNTKTVIFTAAKSFTYTPYWYTTDVQKPYNINVNVS